MDDAGRGAVLGPLVIAGVLFRAEDLPKLDELGVRDSKLLSPGRRERLAQAVQRVALRVEVKVIPPGEIDRVVLYGRRLRRLNWLEARKMAEVIEALKPDLAYVDASDVLAERFGRQIEEHLPFKVRIISEHGADRRYPIVSAASILAKVERDRIISRLRERYGDLGSGYPSDPRTMNFLREWIARHGSYPDFVRKSWEPAKKLREEVRFRQRRLPEP